MVAAPPPIAFLDFAHSLEAAFRRVEYAESAFPKLAVEYVERARLHETFDLGALARWVLAGSALPPQQDIAAKFGDPPITVWAGRRFFVSVLVWRTSTTSIHQHAFSGAFQVLQGSSVHSRFEFDTRRVFSEDLAIGTLRNVCMERLDRGMVRAIRPSNQDIHALFHLEHPSVSLVVRTYRDEQHPTQYTYYQPGLAIWDLRHDVEQRRACQVARMLVKTDPAQAEFAVGELLPEMPAVDGFALLSELFSAGDLGLALRTLDAAKPRLDAELAAAFEAALHERDRQTCLIRRRASIREPDLRYLLAILLNAPTRMHALSLAAAHTPGRPAPETLVGWLVALSRVTLKLQVGGQPWEPNVLGLPAADDASCEALRAVLAGEPAPVGEPGAFYAAVRYGSTFAPLFRE